MAYDSLFQKPQQTDYSALFQKPGAPSVTGALALPESVGASALDASLRGGQGFGEVHEFGDVLRNRGVPEPLAAAGGMLMAAFNPADPLNYIPIPFAGRFMHGVLEGALKVGSGSKMFTAMERIAEHAGEMPRPLSAIQAEIPNLAAARAKLDEAASKAAKEAYTGRMGTSVRETAPELHVQAVKDAREAAASIRSSLPKDLAEGSDPLSLGLLYNKSLAAVGDRPGVQGVHKLMAQANHARAWFVTNLADNMRTNPHAWGERGGEMAANFEYAAQLAASGEGEGSTFLDKLFKGFSREERTNFSEVADGSGKPISQKVADAVAKWREYDNSLFTQARESGIKQMVPPTHSMGQGELFPDYAAERRQLSLLNNDGGDWTKAPIQYTQDHVYKMRSEKAVRALTTEGSGPRKEAIAKLRETFPNMNDKTAAQALDDALQHTLDPLDIRGGPLQHTRDQILDLLNVPWEKDANVWTRKYAHIANKRVAQALVFGGEDQAWKDYVYGAVDKDGTVLRPGLKQTGGDVPLAENVWRSYIGRPNKEQAAGSDLYRVLRTASTFRLGPRVGVLQMLQLANSAAQFGTGNTGRAVGALLRNPKLQKAAHVVGALLPSQHLAYDASELDNLSSWWIKMVTQMPRGDRFARTVSALAAGHRLTEIGEDLAKGASGAKRRILERELYSLGVDAGQLADQEFKPTLQQIQNAMQRGAKVTQFTSDVTDLPAAARSNGFWRTMFIFRSFSKQQSTFINRVVREATRGNIKPALRYASAFTGMYNVVEPALQFLQGKDYDPARDGEVTDYLKTMFYVGALGSLGDYFTSSSDAGALLQSQVGPVIGTGAGLAAGAGRGVTEGDWQPLSDVATRNLPGGLGTVLINQR